jgi:hypothetical protein
MFFFDFFLINVMISIPWNGTWTHHVALWLTIFFGIKLGSCRLDGHLFHDIAAERLKIDFEFLRGPGWQRQGGKGAREFPRTGNTLPPASEDEPSPWQLPLCCSLECSKPAGNGARVWINTSISGESWIYSTGGQSYRPEILNLKMLDRAHFVILVFSS